MVRGADPIADLGDHGTHGGMLRYRLVAIGAGAVFWALAGITSAAEMQRSQAGVPDTVSFALETERVNTLLASGLHSTLLEGEGNTGAGLGAASIAAPGPSAGTDRRATARTTTTTPSGAGSGAFPPERTRPAVSPNATGTGIAPVGSATPEAQQAGQTNSIPTASPR